MVVIGLYLLLLLYKYNEELKINNNENYYFYIWSSYDHISTNIRLFLIGIILFERENKGLSSGIDIINDIMMLNRV